MTTRRTRVLEIAAEGGGFELDAELDHTGRALAYFTSSGGAHDYEDVFDEPVEARVEHGPMSWQEVLQLWLRPHGWLSQHPRWVHPSIVSLVRRELGASDNTTAPWWSALGDSFRNAVTALYEAHPHRIEPFIGEVFATGRPGSMRVMTIGINAYLSPADWERQIPGWTAGWFREGRHRFFRAVAEDASTISRAMASAECFNGLAYAGKENIFHTNAIKSFVRESEGKRSDQIDRRQFETFAATWHAELDAMAQHGVLPHVVIVFGRPFWEWAWRAFHLETRPSFSHLRVHGFENAQNDGRHFANRIEVEGAAGKHALALLALRHPAARAASKATPDWLLAQNDIRKLFCLADR